MCETSRVLAFHHTRPSWDLHIVLVPKRHVATLTEVEDAALFAEILQTAVRIITDLGLAQTNYKLIVNGGSYQSTPHLHFHLVSGRPRDLHDPAQKGELLV